MLLRLLSHGRIPLVTYPVGWHGRQTRRLIRTVELCLPGLDFLHREYGLGIHEVSRHVLVDLALVEERLYNALSLRFRYVTHLIITPFDLCSRDEVVLVHVLGGAGRISAIEDALGSCFHWLLVCHGRGLHGRDGRDIG